MTRGIGLLCAAALLACLGASAQAQTVLKGGHINPKDSVEGVVADRWAALMKAKTNGALGAEVFPSEQLGKAPAQIDATILGNQDFYLGGSVEFERFSPALKIVGLNYSVPDINGFHKLLASPLWKEILYKPLDDAGLVVIDDWERGPFRVMVSTRPVSSVADFKGVKLRIAPIDTWRRSWGALGANVVVLPWTDVYLGMQQGIIEAVTSPITLVEPNKFYEVAKHVTRIDEFWQTLALVVNKDRFNKLPAAHKTAMREAAVEAGKEYVAAQFADADKIVERLKARGVTYSVLDTKPAVQIMTGVIRDLEKDKFIPAGLYDRIQALK